MRSFCFEVYRSADGRGLVPSAVFVRVPFIGQAFVGKGMTAFDSWRALRATGEVR